MVLVKAFVPAMVIAESGIDAGLDVMVRVTDAWPGPVTVTVNGVPTAGVLSETVPPLL